MPEVNLDALREVLPLWVNVFAWIGLPLVGLIFGMLCTWLADRVNRPNFEGLHWTEKARLHFAGSKIVGLQSMIYAALTGTVTYMHFGGLLTPGNPVRQAVLAGLFVWIATMVVSFRRSQRVSPSLTMRELVVGVVFWWVVFMPVLLVTMLMAMLGPAELGWTFGIVYGSGALAMVWLVCGGSVRLGRVVRVIIPADERVTRIVAETTARTGHAPKRVWLGRTPMANAVAFPVANELLFTTRAMDRLNDAELLAITLHEVGHLKETKNDSFKRLMSVSLFFVLGMWRPIVESLGTIWFLVLLLLSLVIAVLSLRTSQRLESEADQHAHEHQHEDEEGTYARALERLHEVNLTPAVAQGKHNTHPHLYDRMTNAGVTPDYPRPEPPPRKGRQVILSCILGVVFVSVVIVVVDTLKRSAYDSPTHALWAVAVSSGDVWSIGALGAKWEEPDPEKAVVALSFAATNHDWPEFPARLARVLAGTNPSAARAALQRAEKTLAEWDEVDKWLRNIVDGARSKLGMPDKDW